MRSNVVGFFKKNKKANWEINLKSTEANFDKSSLTQLKEFITANCPDYGLGLVGAMVAGLDISGGHYVWSCSGENLYGYMIFADVFLQLEDSEDFDFQWNENHILKDQTFIDVEGETAQKSTVFWELLIGNDAGHKRYLKQEDLCISINDEKIPIRDDIDESELTKSLASSEYTATDDFKNEMGGFDFSIGTEPTASDREWSVFEHLTYYFLAFAIFTDGDLDERESAKIYEILCRFTSTENEEELREEITPIINNAFTKLNSDLEISTDNNPIVQKHLSGLIPHIKSDIPANMHSELVKILIEIGNVDGDFSDGEKGWVQQFADDLGLDIDFEDEEAETEKVENGNESKDYPVISFTSFGAENDAVVHDYMEKWLLKTEYYCRRAGIVARVPDCVGEINAVCPKWTKEQLDQIKTNISENKIIPSLSYLPDQFYSFSKQIWWFAPFVIWKEEVASWIFIDKNGIYAAHPGDNEGTLIYPWDSIDYIDIEDVSDFDTDEPDNVVKMTVHRNDSEGFLTFCEFVAEGSGSYLKVIEEIFEVFSPVIEASAGEGTWFHGVGKEGYKTFNSPDELLVDSCWEGADFPNPAFFGYVAPEEETLEPQVVETESIVEDEIPEKPIKDEAPADVPVASKKDNAELEVYLNDPKSKYNGPDFKNTRTLIRHIVNDLNSSFPDYRFEYSASMGLSLFGDETGKSKFAGCFIRNKEMVGFDFLRDYENDYRRPKIEGVLVENRRSNQRFIEWYRVFFNSVEQYDENKEKLYSILKSSEKMKMKLSDKLLSKQKFTASDKSKYQKYLDKDYTFELEKADKKKKLEPKYIQSTYRELKNMGFKGYEITYTWDADAEFIVEENEHFEGSTDSNEIMAPWENISIPEFNQ